MDRRKPKLSLMIYFAVLFFAVGVFAGELDPPAEPDDSGSAMYTLDDLYNRLDTGAAGEKRDGGFTGPTAPPASTGATIDDIMANMPAADNIDGARLEDVASGKTYWGLRTDGTWGTQTGEQAIRFIDNNDGTISDKQTGLMWIKAHDSTQRNWSDADSYCDSLKYATYTDWRLPEIYELFSIVDRRNSAPALPAVHPFNNVQSDNYWSSTTYASDTDYAWSVYMYNGSVLGANKVSFSYYVWPVRSDN